MTWKIYIFFHNSCYKPVEGLGMVQHKMYVVMLQFTGCDLSNPDFFVIIYLCSTDAYLQIQRNIMQNWRNKVNNLGT